jgi:DNA-binding CsgD family transcriptional regulator
MPRIGWESSKGAQIVALLREGKTPDEIASAIKTGTGAVKGFYKRNRQRMDSTSTKARAKRPRSSPAIQHGDDIARIVETLVTARVNKALARAVSALRDALRQG